MYPHIKNILNDTFNLETFSLNRYNRNKAKRTLHKTNILIEKKILELIIENDGYITDEIQSDESYNVSNQDLQDFKTKYPNIIFY